MLACLRWAPPAAAKLSATRGSMPQHGSMLHTWAPLSLPPTVCADTWRVSPRRSRRSSPRLLTAAPPPCDAPCVASVCVPLRQCMTPLHACGAVPGLCPRRSQRPRLHSCRARVCVTVHAYACVRPGLCPLHSRAVALKAPCGRVQVECVCVPRSGEWRICAKRDGRCDADVWACGIAPPR